MDILDMQGIWNDGLPAGKIIQMRRTVGSQEQKHLPGVFFGLVCASRRFNCLLCNLHFRSRGYCFCIAGETIEKMRAQLDYGGSEATSRGLFDEVAQVAQLA